MQVVSGLLSCYTGSCFGEAHPADRAPSDRHSCPQLFKLKSLVVHIPSCNSRLRLESTNCKIACLPTGLVKKIVFMYLQGRYENSIASVDTTDEEASDDDAGSSSDGSYPSPIHNAPAPPITATSSITSSATSMHEAYSFARNGFPDVSNDLSDSGGIGSASLNLKVLQDTYMLTFRKGTAAKEKELVEVKLFMVNKSPTHDSGDMKIVHVLLRDHLWVDIVVSDSSPAAMAFDTSEILESHTVFQLDPCDACGEFRDVCACGDASSASKPVTIWRREEDIRMDECVVKKKTRHGDVDWHDQLVTRPTQHQCTATCDAIVRELRLTLVLAAHVAQHAEFELTLTSSKRVQDLSDQVYTVFCITVCHGDLKWHITRRFRDFAHLRDQLAQELPDAVDLPVLPPKTWLPTIDVKFIHERQLRLEQFLRHLSLRSDTLQSVAFLSFLGAVSSPRLEHEWISGVPRDVIHLRILHRYVETGDILLFQSKNHMSGVQRTMTGAEWDHVAMVVEAPQAKPNQPPKFLLLEATGDGVTLLPLVPRILAYNSCFINYIALRKLRMPPRYRDTFHQRMHAFLALVEGKPYSMTLNKLIRPNETNADFAGFFCSELIAAAYKASGLIHERTAASSFWPGSFGIGGDVDKELNVRDAYLEREVVIDCRVLEIALANKDVDGGRGVGAGTVVHHP